MYQHQQTCPTCGSCPTCGRQARPFSPGFYPYWNWGGSWPYSTTTVGNFGLAQTVTTNATGGSLADYNKGAQ